MMLGGVLTRGELTAKNEELFTSPPKWMTPEISQSLRGLYKLHDNTGISLPALALRFVIADRDVTTVLIGAATPRRSRKMSRRPAPDRCLQISIKLSKIWWWSPQASPPGNPAPDRDSAWPVNRHPTSSPLSVASSHSPRRESRPQLPTTWRIGFAGAGARFDLRARGCRSAWSWWLIFLAQYHPAEVFLRMVQPLLNVGHQLGV